MNNNVTHEATISNWIRDVNLYTYNGVKYWIHKIPIHDNWVLTNFAYDLTNIDLKTVDLKIAEQRSQVMLKTKHTMLQNAISTLTNFTDFIKKKSKRSLLLSPQLSKTVIDFTSKINKFHNI